MVDTSDLRRRISVLEHKTSMIHRIIRKVVRRIWPQKVNPVSRELSDVDKALFRARMAEHGMEDESRGGKTKARKCR